ncbi:MAG: hypothetical protein HLUCCX21_04995 [Porphyrobacter sp. HL-46]|nr:MAG: hypothetical protein HLUCCX21_04995 [Porphyrobacter sp. HL-46]
MKGLWLSMLAGLLGGLSVIGGNALAADRKAQDMVGEMAQVRDSLIAKHPSLAAIDDAVRADCSAKGEGVAPDSPFCSCASAVTFGLWMSGMDPKMVDRLNVFLQAPSAEAASAFTAYQGPELYAPLCRRAI